MLFWIFLFLSLSSCVTIDGTFSLDLKVEGNSNVELLGSSTGLDGDFAFFGAGAGKNHSSACSSSSDCGHVRLYMLQGGYWIFQKFIVATPGDNDFEFATALSANEGRLLVNEPDNQRAYIFERDTGGSNNYGIEATLVSQFGNEHCGRALLRGDLAFCDSFNVVEVYGRNMGGANNWGFLANVTKPVASTGNNEGFGTVQAFNGEYLAVATPFENSPTFQGQIFLFRLDTGDQFEFVKEIEPPISGDPLNFDYSGYGRFGIDMTFDVHSLIVGFPGANNGSGVVVVYGQDVGGSGNFGHVQTIQASSIAPLSQFGNSLSAHNDVLVVSSPNVAGGSAGRVYVFTREDGASNYIEVQSFIPSGNVDAGFDDSYTYNALVSGPLVTVECLDECRIAIGDPGFSGDRGQVWIYSAAFTPTGSSSTSTSSTAGGGDGSGNSSAASQLDTFFF